MTFRPPTPEDIPRLVDLQRAADIERGLDPVTVPADIETYWSLPRFDRRRHAIVAETPQGIVACGHLFLRRDHAVSLAHVAPAWRGKGIGRELVAWAVRTCRAEPDLNDLYVAVPARPDALALLDGSPGFEYARTFFTMLNRAPGDLPEPEWPPGIRLVPLGNDALLDAVLEAHAGSFIDHWNYTPLDRGTLDVWLRHPDEDPSLWFTAFSGSRIAGFCLCNYERGPSMTRGWISDVGTLRAFRGIGLGKALLRHACRTFAGRGIGAVGLEVDAENPTGALGLYERSGFQVASETRRYRVRLR